MKQQREETLGELKAMQAESIRLRRELARRRFPMTAEHKLLAREQKP